jgi:acetyl-CoA carboxylase carboxyltransferase component
MGLEGAVRLGFSKELEALSDPQERESLFNRLVRQAYEAGKATEAAAHLEIDAVIDPADTRAVILRAFASAGWKAPTDMRN